MTLVDRLVTLGLEPWTDPVRVSRDELMAIALASPHGGLAPLLGAACELGLVHCDDGDMAAEAARIWTERLVAVVSLDAVLVSVTDRLHEAGVEHRVLKGAAVARLDEIDPSWRTYGDVDVLVRDADFLDAAQSLAAIGFTPVHEPVRRSWAERFAKSITLVDSTGRQVDLHRRLAVGPLGDRLDADRLFADPEAFDVGGQTVMALNRVQRAAHASAHAALSPQRSHRHRRDVLLLTSGVGLDALDEILAAGWSATLVADGVTWAAGAHGSAGEWATWGREHIADPDVAALVVAARGGFRQVARSTVRHLPFPDTMRYLGGLVLPSRQHLASRGLTRSGHLRSLVRGEMS